MILLITSYQTFSICVAKSIFTCHKIQSSNDNILLAKKNACKQHWKMTIYDSLNTEFNGQHQRSILFWPQGNALYLYSDHMQDKSLKYSIICTKRIAALTVITTTTANNNKVVGSSSSVSIKHCFTSLRTKHLWHAKPNSLENSLKQIHMSQYTADDATPKIMLLLRASVHESSNVSINRCCI